MYSLVNDVAAYPQFLQWCSGARVISSTDRQMIAEVDVGLAGFRQSFSTCNTLEPPNRIGIQLRDGPFSRLEGEWRFLDGAAGCTIDLSLEFSVSLSPLGLVLSRVFEEIARSQMDAFIRRARAIYA